MAYEVQIRNSTNQAKVRSPLGVAVLSFVTLGIYGLVWYYKINRELRDLGRAKGYDLGQNPTNSLLAVLFGWILLLIPPIISIYNTTKRVQQSQRVAGMTDTLNGWIGLVLILVFSPAFYAYLQSELNKTWQVEGIPGPDAPPDHGQLQAGMPPAAPTAQTPEQQAPAPPPAPGQPTPEGPAGGSETGGGQ